MARRFMGGLVIGAALLVLPGAAARSGPAGFPVLKGPYLGQRPPGDEPVLFAPGIVSTGLGTRDVAITPDGREIYFTVQVGNHAFMAIVETKLVGGRWTKPEVAPFSAEPGQRSAEPHISPDGSKFFFVSDRPDPARGQPAGNWDIWVMERTGDGWGPPRNLGPPVNTDGGEYFPSVTRGGTLYFTREVGGERTNSIHRSRWADGRYGEPEELGPQVNSGLGRFNAFVAPDESYLIVPVVGRPDSRGGTDYYIVYRGPDDTWSDPINLGGLINTPGGREWSPYVSLDGKYFFFMSARAAGRDRAPGERLTYQGLRKRHLEPGNGNPAIYWVSASFIERLRPRPKGDGL